MVAGGVFDFTAPTVAIQNVPANPNSAFTATIQFSESVSGFVVGDITAGNAALSGFTAVDGDTYTVLVTPTADGAFTLNVGAGVATDTAGNGNTAATGAGGTFDASAPTVAIQNVPANTNAAFTATIQFSESVSGFVVGDISAANAALSAFTAVDGDTYTVLVTPGAEGAFTLDVAAGVATDVAGNNNTAASQAAGSFDATAPTVVIEDVPADTNSAFTATIQFGESVTGFVEADISASNASLSGFTAVDSDTYTALVTPTAEGVFSLDIAAAAANDSAGNDSTVALQASGRFDSSAPTVAIQGVPALTNAAFTATIQFSETVNGFVVGDISAANAALSGFTAVDGDTYTVLVTPAADGPYSLDVAAAVATDAAGNGNGAASQAAGSFDNTAPGVAIQGVPALTNTAFTATIQFSEAVSGFAIGDISAANAALSGFTAVDADTYTVLVTPAAEGAFTLDVAAAAAVDTVGNSSQAATQADGTFDVTPPATATLSSVSSDTGADGADGITSDNTLLLFGTGDPDSVITVFLDGASIGTAVVSPLGDWTLDYSSTALLDGSYAITVRAEDGAGNTSPLSPAFALRVDTRAPNAPSVVAISADTGAVGDDGITRDNTLVLTGTAESGATVTVRRDGGLVGVVTANGDGDWLLDDTGTTLADGSYVLTATATDAAGNISAASTDFDLTVDTGVPSAPTIDAIGDDTGSAADDGITADNTLFVSGRGEPGVTVELFIGGVSIGSTTVGAGGDWSFDYSATPLADGDYTLTSQVSDAAGNVSVASAAFPITVDTAAPSAPLLDQNGQTLADNTPTLTGTAEPGATVTVTLAGGEALQTVTNGAGLWSVTATVALAEGPVAVTLVAEDAAGNRSGDGVAAITVDIEISALNSSVSVSPATLPADGASTATISVSARDTLNQPQAGLTLVIDAGAAAVGAVLDNGNGTYTATLTAPLVSGGASVRVIAAGDLVGEQPVTFTAVDADNDGLSNDDEDLDGDGNPANDDLDGDGTPNYLDDDDDGDGKTTEEEDINNDGNPFNDDSDGDGIPDFLDGDDDSGDGNNDSDGDGIADTIECSGGLPCPDSDGDGRPDYMDDDDDNDGIPSVTEGEERDSDGDGTPDYRDPDDDNDGLLTRDEDADGDSDGDPSTSPGPDLDGDGIPAYLDPNDGLPGVGDTDGDGIGDDVECGAGGRCEDSDGDGRPDFNDPDDDNDGIDTRDEDVDTDGDPANDDTDGDGTPNYLDRDDDDDGVNSDLEGTGDSDGDGIPDHLDRDNSGAIDGSGDSDGDGLSDAFECPSGLPCRDSDGDGVPDYLDDDDDNDGVLTRDEDVDEDGDAANDDVDGDGTPNYLDRDDDGDGVDTVLEGTGDSDGDGIPDHLDPSAGDSDGDGLGDGIECPSGVPCPDLNGNGVPDFMDPDDDGDGVPTVDEDLDGDGDPRNEDSDGDGTPDYRDTDDDDDGRDSIIEGDGDSDGDGIPDYLDRDSGGAAGGGDSDGDGISDALECPTGIPCRDSDGDGVPDYLDEDDDNDGINTRDEDPDGNGDPLTADTDRDGTENYLDRDDDGDGIDTSAEGTGDSDGDGIPDHLDPSAGDSDGDGIGDGVECPDGIPCRDSDGDGIADYLDDDDDNDGVLTTDENANGLNGPVDDDTDGDGIADYLDTDDDNDGQPTAAEGTGDADGDSIPDYLDPDSSNTAATTDGSGDSDGDGKSDLKECPLGPPCPDSDRDGIPDYLDAPSAKGGSGQVGQIQTALNSAGSLAWLSLMALLLVALRRLKLPMLLLVAGIAQADNSATEADDVSVYVGAGVGLSWLEPGTDESSYRVGSERSQGWQALAGWRWREDISVEGFYADLGAATLRERGTGVRADLDYAAYGALANWYPRQRSWGGQNEGRWYLQGGLTSLRNDSSLPVDKTRGMQLTVGAGYDYELSDRWALRVALQGHNIDAVFLSVNLLKAFAPSRAAAAHRIPAAAGVVASSVREAPPVQPLTPVDSDGDGIADSLDQCTATPPDSQVNAQGCTALDINLEGLVFDSGSADIDATDHAILERVVAALRQFPAARVEIAAHTDSVGSEAYNQQLSEQRADAVVAYLTSEGIDSARLQARGYGESRPVADNATAEGRALNRRVEVRLLSAQ